MLTTKQMNLIFGSFSLIILATSIQIDAQFFTKSSKSIPRMGRRSDNSLATSQYRHQLIDSLIDEYGPHFVAALEGKSIGLEEARDQDQGEIVSQNNQPFDYITKRIPSLISQSRYDTTGYEPMMDQQQQTRDERSPSQHSSYRDTSSLAMRALNLNRLMQHLASGGQPLMSYEKLFNGQNGGHGGGGGELGSLEQQSMGKQQQQQQPKQLLQLED